MNVCIHSHVSRMWYQFITDALSCKGEIIYYDVCLYFTLLVINLNLSTLTIFLIDSDVKILFERCWGVLKQKISQTLSLQTMIILLICIKLKLFMKLLIKLRTVTWDFDSKVSILLRLFHFIKLFKWGFLNICGVNFFNWCLKHVPREFAR